MPRRGPAHARRARRRERRHQHRLRRFALLTLITTVTVVTLGLTAFGGEPEQTAAITPVPAQRLLPAGRPQPLVIANLNGLRIQLPIAAQRVTAIGFHGAGEGTLALDPVGRQGNEGLLARIGHKLFGGNGGGPLWYQLGGGSGPNTGGLDVGAPVGTEVYAPIDGTIVGLTPFVVNGRTFGTRVDIQPAAAPSVVVSLSHLEADTRLSVGAEVTATRTRIGSVADLSGVERQALARYSNDAGNHLALEVRPAATLTLP